MHKTNFQTHISPDLLPNFEVFLLRHSNDRITIHDLLWVCLRSVGPSKRRHKRRRHLQRTTGLRVPRAAYDYRDRLGRRPTDRQTDAVSSSSGGARKIPCLAMTQSNSSARRRIRESLHDRAQLCLLRLGATLAPSGEMLCLYGGSRGR